MLRQTRKWHSDSLATLSFISRKELVAIAAVVEIATHARDRPVSAKDMAARHKLHSRFFEEALGYLVTSGVIIGRRGNRLGGYQLARSSELISVADIIRAVSVVRDVAHSDIHPLIEKSAIIPALALAEKELFFALERITIQQLVPSSEEP